MNRSRSRLVPLLVSAWLLSACGGGHTQSGPQAHEATDATDADHVRHVNDTGLAALPAADPLGRSIPGIAPLAAAADSEPEPPAATTAPKLDPAPDNEPATDAEPAAADTPTPEPDPAPPPAPELEPPATTAPPKPQHGPDPEPAAAACEGYRVEDLLFESGSPEVTDEAAASFAALVERIAPPAEVAVFGHTDGRPARIGNQRLSELRARAVADALVAAGLAPSAIVEVAGRAEAEPIATNETADGRRLNRRVEVFVNCPTSPA